MPRYTSGVEVLADGRIRLDAMSDDASILVVEGRDDFLTFAPRCGTVTSIITAGKKYHVLDAHDHLRPDERDRFVFVVDCDYDVPAGRLAPGPNLILTRNSDRET